MTANDWDKLSSLYSTFQHYTTGPHCQYAVDHILTITPTTTLLDIGCGAGALSLHAAQCGATVTSVDYSDDMVNIVQQRAAQLQLHNVTAIKGSAVDMSPLYGQQFDVITCAFVLMYDIDIDKAITECLKLAKPNCTLLFITWNGADNMSWVKRIRRAKSVALQHTAGTMAYTADAPHPGCSAKHDIAIEQALLQHNVPSTVTVHTCRATLPHDLSSFYDSWYFDELDKSTSQTVKQQWMSDITADATANEHAPMFEGSALLRIAIRIGHG